MSSPLKELSSSIGSKIVIALTGLAMVLFLLGHLAGNLLLVVDLLRADSTLFNDYAHQLISNPLLIPVELCLLTILVVHVYKTVRITRQNRLARPSRYERKEPAGFTSRKSFASSTMIYSGLVILVFVGLHLRTFKWGTQYEVAGNEPIRDLSRLVLEVFHEPGYVLFYVIAMVILGLHLRHGLSSALQSLGVDHPYLTPKLVLAGKVLAFVIAGGFALIPIFVFLTR